MDIKFHSELTSKHSQLCRSQYLARSTAAEMVFFVLLALVFDWTGVFVVALTMASLMTNVIALIFPKLSKITLASTCMTLVFCNGVLLTALHNCLYA